MQKRTHPKQYIGLKGDFHDKVHLGHRAGSGGRAHVRLSCGGSSGEGLGHTRGRAGHTEYFLPLLPGGRLAGVSPSMLSSLSLLPKASSAVLTGILEGSSLSSLAKIYLKPLIILTMLI